MERERRVLLLVLAMVLMGFTDLACTLVYMRNVGMVELNPLARLIAAEAGWVGLAAFKVATIALSTTILLALRARRQSECCAWIGVIALLILTAHWVRYNATAPSMTAVFHELAAAAPPEWVRFTD